MKKILSLVAAVMLFGATSMAQASFGVGYMNPKTSNDNDAKALTTFYAGFDYNVLLSDNFGIAPGVYYSYGFNTNTLDLATTTTITTLSEHYIGIPVNLNYSLKLAPDFAITFYAGPTFSYGIVSQTKSHFTESITKITRDETFNNYDNGNYKPFDVLVGGGVAFDWAEMFRLSVGYNYGILDRNASDNVTFNRNYLHMGIAYLF